MAILARLRIRSRLLLLLAFFVVALLALGIFSAMTIQVEAARATAFIDIEFASERTLSDVRAAHGVLKKTFF